MTRLGAAALLAGWLAGSGCAEDARPEELFTAVSGARLALQQLRYDDGTEQATTGELYDTEVHARCAPRPWADGVVRCVPLADDAVYTDAACTRLVGRARTISNPELFLAYAGIGGAVRPARLFRAGAAVAEVAAYYELQDGQCTGPHPSPGDPIAYFAVEDELDGAGLVPMRDGEVGQGRLGLRVRESDDGARIPLGLTDRALAAPCAAEVGEGGGVRCAPAGAAPAGYFVDRACSEAVAAVPLGAPVPAIAAVVEPSGCTRYRAVAGELESAPLYRRDGDACTLVAPPPDARLFGTGAALELAPIARTLEDAPAPESGPARRLRRIVLEIDAAAPGSLEPAPLRFFDDRLHDTGTRSDCRGRRLGDVPRCVPALTAPVRTLYALGCGIAIPVAELPRVACEPVAFAAAAVEDTIELRAIGDPVAGAVFDIQEGQCVPYAGSPAAPAHALGPPLDPSAFVGAIVYGVR